MYNTELIRHQINQLVTQARYDISMLANSNVNDTIAKQRSLQSLWDTLSSIQFLSELFANQITMMKIATSPQPLPQVTNGNFNQSTIPPITPSPNQQNIQPNQRLFTLQQLANYDGKNGRAAYVAVNGIVYDVTNNRAWAAATHFGLTSGKNHTAEFASCHAGQESILATLPIVGRLANGAGTSSRRFIK